MGLSSSSNLKNAFASTHFSENLVRNKVNVHGLVADQKNGYSKDDGNDPFEGRFPLL